MNTPLHRRSLLVACVGVALLSACTDKREAASTDTRGEVKVVFDNDAARNVAVGPNDVRIVSTDGVLILSLIGDTVRIQLSDSLRGAVADNVTKDVGSGDDESGLGKLIAKSVSQVVAGAMGFVVRVPAADVQNLRFENGHIRFDIRNSNNKVNINGDSSKNAIFIESDARRFINAVNARARRNEAM